MPTLKYSYPDENWYEEYQGFYLRPTLATAAAADGARLFMTRVDLLIHYKHVLVRSHDHTEW